MGNLAPVYVFATLDTKLEEASFLTDAIREEGRAHRILIDVGTLNAPTVKPGIEPATVTPLIRRAWRLCSASTIAEPL